MVMAIPKRMTPEMARSTRLFKTTESSERQRSEIQQRPNSGLQSSATLTKVPGGQFAAALGVERSLGADAPAVVQTLLGVVLGCHDVLLVMMLSDFKVILVPAQVHKCTMKVC